MQNVDILVRCDTVATRHDPSETLYAMAGPCDQSTGDMVNFSGSTWSVDGSYSAGTRGDYVISLTEVISPLAGSGSRWYQLVDSRLQELPNCLCWTVFSQAGGSPAESDPVVASGSMSC